MFQLDAAAEMLGVTPVENLFIRDYLPAAKGDQVKVYLFALYQAHRGGRFTVEDAARDLDMQVSEIESALRYWERRRLITREQNDPPLYTVHSALQGPGDGLAQREDASYVDFAESVYAAFGDRRKVRPGEIAAAWEWVQEIGLSPEAVLMLINHMIAASGPQFSFRKAESTAAAMREGGVVTAEDAESWLKNDQATRKGADAVLRALGRRGRFASDAELALYRKWREEWNFSHEAILEATKETTKGDATFAYLDGILSGLRTRGAGGSASDVKETLKSEQDVYALAREALGGLRPQLARSVIVNLYQQWRLTFPHEVLVLAGQECRRAGGGAEDMAMLLDAWEKKGLKDENAVREYLDHFRADNADLKEIFAQCALSQRPTQRDRAWLRAWREKGMGQELLLFAAEKARGIQGNKLSYIDKVLSAWHEDGIRSLDQAKAAAPQGKPSRQVSAQQYRQRVYTEEELSGASGDLMREAMEETDE